MHNKRKNATDAARRSLKNAIDTDEMLGKIASFLGGDESLDLVDVLYKHEQYGASWALVLTKMSPDEFMDTGKRFSMIPLNRVVIGDRSVEFAPVDYARQLRNVRRERIEPVVLDIRCDWPGYTEITAKFYTQIGGSTIAVRTPIESSPLAEIYNHAIYETNPHLRLRGKLRDHNTPVQYWAVPNSSAFAATCYFEENWITCLSRMA